MLFFSLKYQKILGSHNNPISAGNDVVLRHLRCGSVGLILVIMLLYKGFCGKLWIRESGNEIMNENTRVINNPFCFSALGAGRGYRCYIVIRVWIAQGWFTNILITLVVLIIDIDLIFTILVFWMLFPLHSCESCFEEKMIIRCEGDAFNIHNHDH